MATNKNILDADGQPRPLVTAQSTFSPIDGREKVYIYDEESIDTVIKNVQCPYPHLRVHVHKKIFDTDSPTILIGEECVGIYEIDELNVKISYGVISSVTVKSYHQVYSTSMGAASSYFIPYAYDDVTTAKADSDVTIAKDVYVAIGEKAYKCVASAGVALSSLTAETLANTDNFTESTDYVKVNSKWIASIYKDVIYYCTDTSGDYQNKILLNAQVYGGSDYTLPTATTSNLGGVKVGTGLSINDGVLSADFTTASDAEIIALFN